MRGDPQRGGKGGAEKNTITKASLNRQKERLSKRKERTFRAGMVGGGGGSA